MLLYAIKPFIFVILIKLKSMRIILLGIAQQSYIHSDTKKKKKKSYCR